MTKLVDAVKRALENGVQKPVLRFGDYKFSKARKYPCMYVTFRDFYLGKVSLPEEKFLSVAASENQKAEIESMLSNIEPYMESHGRETGTCCICGRMLTNEESVRLMIGPICGGRWGFLTELVKAAGTEAKDSPAPKINATKESKIKDISQDKFDFSDL